MITGFKSDLRRCTFQSHHPLKTKRRNQNPNPDSVREQPKQKPMPKLHRTPRPDNTSGRFYFGWVLGAKKYLWNATWKRPVFSWRPVTFFDPARWYRTWPVVGRFKSSVIRVRVGQSIHQVGRLVWTVTREAIGVGKRTGVDFWLGGSGRDGSQNHGRRFGVRVMGRPILGAVVLRAIWVKRNLISKHKLSVWIRDCLFHPRLLLGAMGSICIRYFLRICEATEVYFCQSFGKRLLVTNESYRRASPTLGHAVRQIWNPHISVCDALVLRIARIRICDDKTYKNIIISKNLIAS